MVYKDIVVFSNYESPNDSDIQIVPFCWECFLYSFVLVLDGMTEKQWFWRAWSAKCGKYPVV